jgi:hypothetical protein
MFGHDDQSHKQGASLPATDSGLTTDDGQILSPPQAQTDTSDFIETDAPGMPVQPTAPVTEAPQAPATVQPAAPAPAGGSGDTDQLLDIKQQALQQLSPLIGHLEQSPEEKFRTTMMMIQAADNDALIKTAYETALQITDEKVRAQALLDVVNEINYFTHSNSDSSPEA